VICETCREGGSFNAYANTTLPPKVVAFIQKRAVASHEKCKGCDCQHKLGPALNKGQPK
jgi:hypothetical protein